MGYSIPPIVGYTIPEDMCFEDRVFYYSHWIQLNPFSHIHFKLDGETKGFISDRHVNLG